MSIPYLKEKNDALLCCTDNMLFAVLVEVDAMNRATYFLVLQHTLRTVPKRQDADACTANRSLCSQLIHIIVRDAFGSNGALHPRIENARTVDAQQDAQTGLPAAWLTCAKVLTRDLGS